MSTMEALQVGLAIRDFQEENDLIEKGGFDYDVIRKIDTGIPQQCPVSKCDISGIRKLKKSLIGNLFMNIYSWVNETSLVGVFYLLVIRTFIRYNETEKGNARA